jgi:hypothetical protein
MQWQLAPATSSATTRWISGAHPPTHALVIQVRVDPLHKISSDLFQVGETTWPRRPGETSSLTWVLYFVVVSNSSSLARGRRCNPTPACITTTLTLCRFRADKAIKWIYEILQLTENA